jgi:hypothetical protein
MRHEYPYHLWLYVALVSIFVVKKELNQITPLTAALLWYRDTRQPYKGVHGSNTPCIFRQQIRWIDNGKLS